MEDQWALEGDHHGLKETNKGSPVVTSGALDILREFGSNFSFDTSLGVLSNQLSLPEAHVIICKIGMILVTMQGY